jgi:2-polyprenyl-3-methyl-5-hydroxy-6-metoxy-1,4-benzoquinol methylase
LGGHKITRKGLENFVHQRKIAIVEIGCGGGDNLRILKKWAATNKIEATLTGIDINNECVQFARQRISNGGINFICSDYRLANFDVLPDIIFSSLFCHHFKDEELVEMIQWMYQHSKKGFFINDLHRHSLAFYLIKWLTKLFSKSYMVKHDAPLSVKRGFLKEEWIDIFNKAGIETFHIRWQWAFRWLIVCKKND